MIAGKFPVAGISVVAYNRVGIDRSTGGVESMEQLRRDSALTREPSFRRLLPTALAAWMALPACTATIPAKYLEQAEKNVTLTDLLRRPESHQGKVVLLGGVIVEDKAEGDRVWLHLRNRPLDDDYEPHRSAFRGTMEDAEYWVVAPSRALPPSYRKWARVTVVGRVTKERPGPKGPPVRQELVLSGMYFRGWNAYGEFSDAWEEKTSPGTISTNPFELRQ
jgi:hypothetical protein